MRPTRKSALIGLVSICLLGIATAPTLATSLVHRNAVQLIELSEVIIEGRVIAVLDGFQNGVPYTEITVEVRESIRGETGSTYTFRQFGLSKKRDLGNGITYLGVSPPGWPRYRAGDQVILFLYKSGSQTGFRSTVGLLQGTFKKRNGAYINGIGNEELFRNVSAPRSELTFDEQEMMRQRIGGIPAQTFVDFVRKAVENRWVETGKLRHVK